MNLTDTSAEDSRGARPTVLARLLRLYLRSGMRGSTRMTDLLAHKVGSLQRVPLDIPGWSPVYVDLRRNVARIMLAESPYAGLWRELDEVSVMRRFVGAGDVAFDVGANVGLHCILLSRLVGPRGHVHAFEPNAELWTALACTVARLGNATLHRVALSDHEEESVLFVPPDDSMASLSNWYEWSANRDDGEPHTVTCQQRRMDDFVEAGTLPRPDFIKCDVEGAELLVFRGARRTLDRPDAPVLLFEANGTAARGFGHGAAEAKEFVASLPLPRYHFFEIKEGGGLRRVREVSPDFSNLVAVPESKIVRWPELAGA